MRPPQETRVRTRQRLIRGYAVRLGTWPVWRGRHPSVRQTGERKRRRICAARYTSKHKESKAIAMIETNPCSVMDCLICVMETPVARNPATTSVVRISSNAKATTSSTRRSDQPHGTRKSSGSDRTTGPRYPGVTTGVNSLCALAEAPVAASFGSWGNGAFTNSGVTSFATGFS